MGTQTKGTLELSTVPPDTNHVEPVTWSKLLTWKADSRLPEPVDLVLNIRGLGGDPQHAGYDFPAHRNMGGEDESWGHAGIVKITLDGWRVIFCDLRNGRFALGCWSSVHVDVTFWGWLDEGGELDLIVRGMVAEATDGDWLLYTYEKNGNSLGYAPPPGARYVDVFLSNGFGPDPIVIDISGRATTTRHDYGTNTYTPPQRPIPLLTRSVAGTGPSHSVIVDDSGMVAGTSYHVVFYIR